MRKLNQHICYTLKNRLFYFLLCMIFVVRMIQLISQYYMDNDTYFILAEGNSILANGIPHINTFTVVPGLSVVIQQWLWDVIVYGCYLAAGNLGLFLLTLATVILTAGLVFKVCGLTNMDKTLRVIITLICLYWLSDYFSTRPNLITFDVLLVEILILEDYKMTGKKQKLIILPVLSLLMINLHSSMWITLFLFLLPYIFPVIRTFVADMTPRTYDAKPLFVTAFIMAITLFFNPYGVDGITYLMKATSGGKLDSIGIAELSNVVMTSLHGGAMILVFILYGVIYIGRKKKICPETAYLFWGTMIMGCMYYRMVGYGAIGTIILLNDILRDTDFTKFHDFANKQTKPILLLACIGVGVVIGNWVQTGVYHETDTAGTPVAAYEYLSRNASSSVSVYTSFNNGAYMEWKGYQVYIDARPELYFKKINHVEDVIDEYLMTERSITKETYDKFKEKYKFDYYIGTDGSLITAYLETDSSMKVVVTGNGYRLFAAKEG